jgi:hypothetical protein
LFEAYPIRTIPGLTVEDVRAICAARHPSLDFSQVFPLKHVAAVTSRAFSPEEQALGFFSR